jgi:hypothetical protein
MTSEDFYMIVTDLMIYHDGGVDDHDDNDPRTCQRMCTGNIVMGTQMLILTFDQFFYAFHMGQFGLVESS